MIPVDVINWLLEPEDPSMRYRTMKELLDKSQNEVQETKSLIFDSDSVKTIFEKMHPEGCWLQKNPRTGEVTGDWVKYGALAS